MVLSYHGATVDPATLNTWLINNKGYSRSGDVIWAGIQNYGRKHGINVTYLGPEGSLDESLCRFGPQIISVNNKGHWVTATGKTSDETTYLINDPNGGDVATIAARYGTYGVVRRFGGPEYTYTDITGITIHFHSPGEFILTDSFGRRTGIDPRTQEVFKEIPGSSYTTIRLDDDETGEIGPETIELDVRQPSAGEYLLQVIGTGTGKYTLELHADDPAGETSVAEALNIPILAGVVHKYMIDYGKTVGTSIDLAGGFNGGGQRPRDVNRFLTYGNIIGSQTSLAAGTTNFSLLIYYGKTIVPASFSAVLNGATITSHFTPAAASSEAVILALNRGRNILSLSANGTAGSRTATDNDKLVFLVP
jgi:hypothetical protein